MTKGACLCVLFIAASGASLAALEWPTAEIHPARFFGQRAEGRIERGIVLEDVSIVRAAGNGTRVISMETNRDMSGFPGTLGNAVIIAHDDGLLSIYGNLDSLDRIGSQTQFETGMIIASAGTSGWTEPASLLFQVSDQERKTVLNPLLVLPSRPDSRGPSIKNVIAVAANNQIAALGTAKFIRQGQYRLYADISDMIDGSPTPLCPFRVSVLVNGSEQAAIPFEILKEEKGKLYLDKIEYNSTTLYGDPERIYLGSITLNRGRADISIIARDTAGNEKSVLFGLQID